MESRVSGSPQRWFGSGTALFPASPATFWSRGSNDARLVRLWCRYSAAMSTLPLPSGNPQEPPPSNRPPSENSMSDPGLHVRPFGVHALPTNVPTDVPNFVVIVGPETPPLRTMLITPAIASEPYCAAAPSRN